MKNNTAIFDLTYGLFLIGARHNGKENGCIVNTISQVASDPARVILSCINGNLTPELIKGSGYFTAAVLDETAPFKLFEDFGLRHGNDIDKFEGYEVFHDDFGTPYIKDHACALLNCKVLSATDLGSHTLFVAEICDMDKLSDNRPVTYSEYHSRIKPKKKAETEKKIIGWKCTICGYIYEGEKLPEDFVCPLCGHPASDFEPIYG
ncbi:MAG: flavin reductase [Erysipelotrichaceae bacterium]|nr:flavin reductase [Erysipelotrichaceae bacterium]